MTWTLKKTLENVRHSLKCGIIESGGLGYNLTVDGWRTEEPDAMQCLLMEERWPHVKYSAAVLSFNVWRFGQSVIRYYCPHQKEVSRFMDIKTVLSNTSALLRGKDIIAGDLSRYRFNHKTGTLDRVVTENEIQDTGLVATGESLVDTGYLSFQEFLDILQTAVIAE